MRMFALAWAVAAATAFAAPPAKPAKGGRKQATAKKVPVPVPVPVPNSSPGEPEAPRAKTMTGPDAKLPTPALVAKAQELYSSLEYEQVIPLVAVLLARSDLTLDQRLEAYRLQGCAKAIVEDPVDAEKPFRLLLRARPQYDLPPETTPKILSVFRKVQSEEQALAKQLREVERERIIAKLKLLGDAPKEGLGGRPIAFSFRLKDPTNAVESIRLPYRRQGQKSYSSLALERSEGGEWSGSVPAEFTVDDVGFTLEYYLETADNEGPLLTVGTALMPQLLPVSAGQLFVERYKPVSRGVFIASASVTAGMGVASGALALLFNASQASYRSMAQGEVDGAKLIATQKQGDTLAAATNAMLVGTGIGVVTTVILATLTNFSPDR